MENKCFRYVHWGVKASSQDDAIEVSKITQTTHDWSHCIRDVRAVGGEAYGDMIHAYDQFMSNNTMDMRREGSRECLEGYSVWKNSTEFAQSAICWTKCFLAVVWKPGCVDIMGFVNMYAAYFFHKATTWILS